MAAVAWERGRPGCHLGGRVGAELPLLLSRGCRVGGRGRGCVPAAPYCRLLLHSAAAGLHSTGVPWRRTGPCPGPRWVSTQQFSTDDAGFGALAGRVHCTIFSPEPKLKKKKHTRKHFVSLRWPTPDLKGPISGLKEPIPDSKGPIPGLKGPISGLKKAIPGLSVYLTPYSAISALISSFASLRRSNVDLRSNLVHSM